MNPDFFTGQTAILIWKNTQKTLEDFRRIAGMKILLVEDDEHLALVLEAVLTDQHHTVDLANDGQRGWELAETFSYDLIVLDVILPNLDGISLCRRLRAHRMTMPILLLTSKDSSDDKVMGFDAGADDYVVKPFDPQELVARIRALLRRGKAPLPLVLEWGRLRLDPSTCEVKYAGHMLHLTPKEYGLLELFMRNSNRVFSRSSILDQLWSFEESPAEETVRAHIKGLRMKLKTAGAPADVIETVYGLGYRLKQCHCERSAATTSTPSRDSLGRLSEPLKEKTQENSKNHQSLATSSSSSRCFVSAETQEKTKAAVSRLWQQFKEPIKNRVTVLEQAILALEDNSLSHELQSHAEQEAHKLAGSLGTYGFAEGSRLARKLEHLFASHPLSKEQAPELSSLVVALQREIEPEENTPTVNNSSLPEATPLLLRPESAPACSVSNNQPSVLLVVEDDPQLIEQLKNAVQSQGMRLTVASNWSAGLSSVSNHAPDVVVLDLSCAGTAEEGLRLLSELTIRTPSIPVLVIASGHGFADRLEVARRGGRAFLQKPVSISEVMDAIVDVLGRFQTHQSKVMIVDDDLHLLAALRTLLKPWGFKLTTLDNPSQFWESLEAFVPDLLVLDVEMPRFSGIELCQVVRGDPRWSGLPVLFLTAHTDADTVHQVFACGADDYVTKPVLGPELVTRILNRLERTQLLRTMAETDPLTGLANRRKSIQELSQFMSLSDRYKQPLCFAILDLDYFKQVNDRYGHAVGDAVLRRLGELLLRSFRSEDVVARWGGEEFMIAMYGMTKEDGVKRLLEFLALFGREVFSGSNGTTFQVTFSAGISQYPIDGKDLQSLYRCADKALYLAKSNGRHRVECLKGNG